MSDLNSLGKKLSFLSSENSFENPFDNDIAPEEIKPISFKHEKSKEEKVSSKKKKKDKFSKIMQDSDEFLNKYASNLIDDFDSYMENSFADDEDINLKNSLIGLGRKYARDTSVTAETSEITKAFSGNEKLLSTLLDEIDNDKARLQKDIDSLRMMRTKNFKVLSEMVDTKSQYQNTALSVIKELNNMKKSQFDLQLKMNKKKDDEEGDGSLGTSKAIQQLFGIGRNNIMSSIGGYEAVSGAILDDDSTGVSSRVYDDIDDELIQKKYFNSDSETDGDKFLKYEDLDVEYVLLIDDDNNKTVIAEDRDGNIIHDYPMPSNVDELNFEINETLGIASDELHRKYKVRRI